MRWKLRSFLALVRRNVVDWFDTWRWFLTIIMLYVFFSYVVKLPIIFLGVVNPIYAYSWIALWAVIAVLLANREIKRRSKTVTGPKWFHNPNAINEYIELMKKSLEEARAVKVNTEKGGIE